MSSSVPDWMLGKSGVNDNKSKNKRATAGRSGVRHTVSRYKKQYKRNKGTNKGFK